MQLAIRDTQQGPFLSQVIAYGVAQQRLSADQLEQIKSKAVLMSLKFADKFYNKYKMDLLEQAAQDIIGVASLGLAELAKEDLDCALTLLTSPESIVKPFQKGWSMLSQVSLIHPASKSLYQDVESQLLAQISSAPNREQWQGLQHYRQALRRWQQGQAMVALKRLFFQVSAEDDAEYFSLEAMLAEVILYRLCCNGAKVQQNLKHKLKHIEIQAQWLDASFLQEYRRSTLALIPSEQADVITADLGPQFISQLIATLKFAQGYQKMLQENVSPERRDAYEFKQSHLHPLLGWPQYIDV